MSLSSRDYTRPARGWHRGLASRRLHVDAIAVLRAAGPRAAPRCVRASFTDSVAFAAPVVAEVSAGW